MPFRTLGHTRASLDAALAECRTRFPTLRWVETPTSGTLAAGTLTTTAGRVVARITLELGGWLDYEVVDRHHPLNNMPVSFDNPADGAAQARFAKNPTRPVNPHRPHLEIFGRRAGPVGR